MSWNLENTAGKDEARKALADAKKNASRSNRIIEAATAQMDRIRGERVDNHFTQRMRQMMQGDTR